MAERLCALTGAIPPEAVDHVGIAGDPQFEKRLPRTVLAPGLARRALTEWYGSSDVLAPEDLHRAKLLASELVTNAVIHGEGQIVLRTESGEGSVLVEVIDEGSGFEYELRRRDFEELHGRGLSIVDAESSRWGIHEGTTHVWFELERSGPRLGPDSKPIV